MEDRELELAPTGMYRESEFPPTEAMYKRSSACEAFHRLDPSQALLLRNIYTITFLENPVHPHIDSTSQRKCASVHRLDLP